MLVKILFKDLSYTILKNENYRLQVIGRRINEDMLKQISF